MDFFKKYVSDSLAGSTSQSFFEDDNTPRRARVYYKLFCGGDREYSLLYSNTTDSTFSDGSVSVRNMPCGAWEILSLRAGTVPSCGMDDPADPAEMQTLTFLGRESKSVAPGEMYHTDPFRLNARAGDFLCLEITFRGGERIPFHPETRLAVFREKDGAWVSDTHLPLPSMIGCRRDVRRRIAFLGDSITQGIGATLNSYRHWNARFAERLGTENAYWNIGIGYARADDAATDGVWLYKAKQNDLVILCLGVNDIQRGYSAESVIESLTKIVTSLKAAGVRVVIQSLPPFDQTGERLTKWTTVNTYIRETLAARADGYVDVTPFLCASPETPSFARYGGHPNDEGSQIWGDALYAASSEWLD